MGERDELLDLLAISDPDRAESIRMLTGEAGLDPALVERATDTLGCVVGTFPTTQPDIVGGMPVAVAGELYTAPKAAAWHRTLGVHPAISRATFADIGRHLALHRRNTGTFGMDDWRWPLLHLAGSLFQLGRLQFNLRRHDAIPGVVAADEWVLDAHIPATGPLTPDAVTASIRTARDFFATTFPGKPVRVIVCTSWLLDPHLIEQLPTSNIAAFARRFTLYQGPNDHPAEALYFVFGTRDLTGVAALPRESALQQLVLDRIATGEAWQSASGYLLLD